MTTSTVVKKLSVAAVGAACIALGSTSLKPSPAQAAILSAPLSINVDLGSGPVSSTAGSVTFDDSFLTGAGLEFLTTGSGLQNLSLTLLGNTYTAASDPRPATFFPRLVFNGGTLLGLNFQFQELTTGTLVQLDDLTQQVFTATSGPIGTYAIGTPTVIPTPALLPGLVGLGISVATLRKRQTEKARQA
ncbi:PTPA-CTERM sorting domain-containing protein [Leptothermofonsia sichuanensis E412]|uniref:PTPA-CTERM sorting domain-containing protein n=1 Tax=Leptothermofonsia sichuanensis TaxID=2917832 RepID=UPI001CA6ACF2|nr:PTPA-CTERM sorting domain-containing protein [Leptothermofonsia sichuanensis]QZZ23128.1 PTPA-CTERM sorting domain-containing protein [Leptothermofonsia sichuanensis E412]